ncbi:hypothetical protein HS7_07760 [Sulfolobales archaeon HS-7]|nr:hypothetical protein HS7_07760 [Sulfolobales archaeon HS-7]
MYKTITRRVQLTGGSTYIVSLPKEWVKQLKLKVGDEVELALQNDMRLILSPKKGLDSENFPQASVQCETANPEIAVREFIAYYMAGYSLVKLICKKMKSEDKEFIKNNVRNRLLGAEVIEEDVDSLEIQFLVGTKELPLLKAIIRAANLSQFMFRDSIMALREGDSETAKEVQVRDDEVDRFYFYIVRQLSIGLLSPNILEDDGFNSSQIMNIYMVSKSIERISDHATRISQLVTQSISAPLEIRELLFNSGIKILDIYKNSINAFRNKKKELAHEIISNSGDALRESIRLSESILHLNSSIATAVSLLMVVDSLRRISRYSIDIAESVIDMLAKD